MRPRSLVFDVETTSDRGPDRFLHSSKTAYSPVVWTALQLIFPGAEKSFELQLTRYS